MVMSGTPWVEAVVRAARMRPIERTIEPADEVNGGST
jgi:hypothetical protein